MEALLIQALIICLVAGVVAFLVKRAPFVDEPYKTYFLYIVMVVVVLWLLLKVVIPIINTV